MAGQDDRGRTLLGAIYSMYSEAEHQMANQRTFVIDIDKNRGERVVVSLRDDVKDLQDREWPYLLELSENLPGTIRTAVAELTPTMALQLRNALSALLKELGL